MPKPDKIKQIMDVFDEIEKSNLTVNQYFKMKKTPFSQKQYYIYKKTVKENGLNGLIDKRINGNNLKLTPEVQSYIKGMIDTNRSIKSLEIENLVRKEFNLDISRTAINCFRKENNLIWVRAEKEPVSKSSFGTIILIITDFGEPRVRGILALKNVSISIDGVKYFHTECIGKKYLCKKNN